jgi:2-succinyl-6-hydroxy-2,4-cyclohexadiene-1-carboxylate synthase
VLYAEEVGKGPPVVLVHGFTQTHRSWQPVAQRLAPAHTLTLVDAPAHAGSDAIRVGLWDGASELGRTAGRAAYGGYSMGGRLCLHLAVARPDLVERLVLVGTTAGIDDPQLRAARRASDEALARQVETDGVAAFVDWWLTRPMFAGLAADAAGRDDRLANTAGGLAASLRLAGTGAMEPLWDRLAPLAMPVLIVAGERDPAFAEAGRRMVRAIGANASLVLIPGAGHACHLERPDAFTSAVADFLAAPAGQAP